ncbi:hypothetical protein [Priestia sp. HNGD-A6]|uniref:hypothetical protein n=1 Tax=Priestia sp. HNGD-A6 TaxID=3092666 RepID=UPI003891C96A
MYNTKTYKGFSFKLAGTITFENRVYHWTSSLFDMVIKIDQTDEEKVSLIVQEKAKPNIKLPFHLLYKVDSYYMVRISDSTQNWEALAFDFYPKNEKVITIEAKHKGPTQQEMNYQVDEKKAVTESKIE